ncbi:hypothetical protein VCSRO173_3431 [Vibrio cholerae]|nr:hypothetical protein VCSRO173_3431 [Vibrio cholerae]
MNVTLNLRTYLKSLVHISQPHNKRFKRDSQRAASLLCVGFCDYGVMPEVC